MTMTSPMAGMRGMMGDAASSPPADQPPDTAALLGDLDAVISRLSAGRPASPQDLDALQSVRDALAADQAEPDESAPAAGPPAPSPSWMDNLHAGMAQRGRKG